MCHYCLDIILPLTGKTAHTGQISLELQIKNKQVWCNTQVAFRNDYINKLSTVTELTSWLTTISKSWFYPSLRVLLHFWKKLSECSHAFVYDGTKNITFTSYATSSSTEDEMPSQKYYFERECGFYAFLIIWCSAGSSLLLSLMHHVALLAAGIVDPGILTLAKIAHISSFLALVKKEPCYRGETTCLCLLRREKGREGQALVVSQGQWYMFLTSSDIRVNPL